MRVFRQASDESRELAMRVIHDGRGQAEIVWSAVLEALKRVRESIKAPNALLDQLQIIFRDESKLMLLFVDVILILYSFSCAKQHLLCPPRLGLWQCRRADGWDVAGEKECCKSNHEVCRLCFLSGT